MAGVLLCVFCHMQPEQRLASSTLSFGVFVSSCLCLKKYLREAEPSGSLCCFIFKTCSFSDQEIELLMPRYKLCLMVSVAKLVREKIPMAKCSSSWDKLSRCSCLWNTLCYSSHPWNDDYFASAAPFGSKSSEGS